MRHDQEFHVELYQNKTTGKFRMSDAYAGEPGTGTVDPPAPAPMDGERWAGSWHPHPKGDPPSEGYYRPGRGPGRGDELVEEGDRARLNMYTARHGPGARSFVSTGGRMRSIDANTIKVPDHGRLVYARPWAGASAFAGGTAATATAGQWNSLFE